MGKRGEVFSSQATTPKRTYYFNVKENRMGDLFLNIVESKKQDNGMFERRQIMVFKEDMPDFLDAFDKAVQFIDRQSGGK
ncbi:MAG: PUR family DNA/RNA-binding protein [Spirochaetales bacterium]|nr:PUR family DNA/RNA-binding protein [Spirochaetales bacterium]MCF7937447.1 PUR family DNA/RNA-binding protein [Spirochaetales bacterium]